MDVSEIKRLIRLVEKSDIEELDIEEKDFKIKIIKGKNIAAPPMYIPHPNVESFEHVHKEAPVQESLKNKSLPDDVVEICAPLVGTFYRASAPDADLYVNNGDIIAPGKVLCIIEAMKLMNEVEAEISGEIVKILVENAQPVEYNQPLFLVKKS